MWYRQLVSVCRSPQQDVSIDSYKENFKGSITFIRVDPSNGHMSIAFQIIMPGFHYDISHAGKGPSHGWSFFTCYNSEQAHTLLEVNASQNDKDFIAAVNWKLAEQLIAEGKGQDMQVSITTTTSAPTAWADRKRKAERKYSILRITPVWCTSCLLLSLPTAAMLTRPVSTLLVEENWQQLFRFIPSRR